MNDVFKTGDKLRLSIGHLSQLDVSFVKRGESVAVTESDGVLLPFDQSSGAAQTVNLTLGDDGSTSVAVTYDETENTIGVNSAVFNTGDHFILDEKKVSVLEY